MFHCLSINNVAHKLYVFFPDSPVEKREIRWFLPKSTLQFLKKNIENQSQEANLIVFYSVYITKHTHSRAKIPVTNVGVAPPLIIQLRDKPQILPELVNFSKKECEKMMSMIAAADRIPFLGMVQTNFYRH